MTVTVDHATFDQLEKWITFLVSTHAEAGREAVRRRDETEALHHWRVLCEMASAGGMVVVAYESPPGRVVAR